MKTPYPYQLTAIEYGKRKNLLLSDECGLGKTITAIEIAKALNAGVKAPALIVAPTETVKLQWLNELQAQGIAQEWIFWLDSKTDSLRLTTVCGGVPFCPTYILTHYEALRKHAPTLQKFTFSIIIADEAHRIKNRKALRTVALKSIRAYRKVALTGTPSDRNPADVWSILNWLEPKFFTSYWRFFDAHVNYDEIVVKLGFKLDAATFRAIREKSASGVSMHDLADWYKLSPRMIERILTQGEIVKTPSKQQPQNPQKLARVLQPFMLRRTKEEVRADLPPRIDQYIDLEMLPAQATAYRKIANANDPIVDLGDGVETSVSIALTKILREIQVTTDPSLLSLLNASSVKLDWVANWLEDNPTESVIIFTRFRETAEKLYQQLNQSRDLDSGYFKLIVGGKRDTITPDDRLIVGTIAAMGEGLDLPHIDNAIFIDVEWSSILMQQARDRIHRINIDKPKNFYYLCCVGTSDRLLHEALQNKWTQKELVEKYLTGKQHAIAKTTIAGPIDS